MIKRIVDLHEKILKPEQQVNTITSPTRNSSTTNKKSGRTDLVRYASWISRVESKQHEADLSHLRDVYPQRFWELANLHLSTIVDVPADFLDNFLETHHEPPTPVLQAYGITKTSQTLRWSNWKPLSKVSQSQNSQTTSSDGRLDTKMVNGLTGIMDYLDTETSLFRKTGSVVRQREIKKLFLEQIQAHGCVDFEKLSFVQRKTRATSKCSVNELINVHDIASVLKLILCELPQPLLTEELLPLFVQVSELTLGNANDKGVRVPLSPEDEILAVAKQLKAVRILMMYLPSTNAAVLRRLLRLLTRTLQFTSKNLMTSEGLGTLFGLLLFAPGKMNSKNLHSMYANLAKLAALLIREGEDSIFRTPSSLALDVYQNCGSGEASGGMMRVCSDDSGLESCGATSLQSSTDCDSNSYAGSSTFSQDVELPPLQTKLVFAKRDSATPTPMATALQTEYAVAELFAQVQALPDSDARKKRLIQRFNASNGGLTPKPRDSHKRGRGLPDLEKATPMPKRQARVSLKKRREPLVDCNNSRINLLDVDDRFPLTLNPSSSSVETPDMLFCCPLVESICSPFRRRLGLSSGRRGRRPKETADGHTPMPRKVRKSVDVDQLSLVLDGAYFPSSDDELDEDVVLEHFFEDHEFDTEANESSFVFMSSQRSLSAHAHEAEAFNVPLSRLRRVHSMIDLH